jgi:oligopeptide/dipeptide ABC transporter ATP-binding protein
MEVLPANHDRATSARLPHLADTQVLRVQNLSVAFKSDSGVEATVLKGVSFSIAHREIVGLLGESGCGKTTTALSIMRLLPPAARVADGSVNFHGTDLFSLDERRLREVRGFQISIIYQDSDVLNPVICVGDQITEVLRAHRHISSAQMRDEVYSVLAEMGFENCDRIYRAYPHQLSGGERRRIAIAQALVCKPRLVIADEPTAWLDLKTTSELLSLFTHLRDAYDASFLLISHDPDTLNIADRLMVMYAGQIVECGPRSEIFLRPKHPYTRALMECRALRLQQSDGHRSRKVACIPGGAPDPFEHLTGCAFSSRCPDRMEGCDLRQPDLMDVSTGHPVRCLKWTDGDRQS